MSIEFLNMAFKCPARPSSLKFVLVAMCDYANEMGEAYPSIETLSNKTSQDRKTVLSNISKLKNLNLIYDTGERKGKTGQVCVYKINLNNILNHTKNGTVKQSQKRNSPKNGTVPLFPEKKPKNGTVKQSQKRDTEPSVLFNHQEEPPDNKNNVELVFDFWKFQLNHPRAKLDEKRKKIIKNALEKIKFTVEELKLAIVGCSKTPHNMGKNDRGQIYDGLHIILKDADQIERFIGNAETPPSPTSATHIAGSWVDDIDPIACGMGGH